MSKLMNAGLVAMVIVTLSSCVKTSTPLGDIGIPITIPGTEKIWPTTEELDGHVRIANGEEMRQLQSMLLSAGYDPNGVDGNYGPGTERAIQRFQTALALPADGQPTRSLIYRLQSPAGSTDAIVSSADLFRSDPRMVRSTSEFSQLFSKGTVTGEELLKELKEIKATARAADSEQAFNNLMGSVDKTKANVYAAENIDWQQILGELIHVGLRQARTTINHEALDQFMDTMLEDRSVLAREKIDLPSPQGLTKGQQQRVLYMAAYVIGARVANQVADEALDTLKNLEEEYTTLLIRRQEIAELLADIVARRNEAIAAKNELEVRDRTAELNQYLSAEDLEFIDRFGADRPIAEFANDFAMQNMAVRFLQRQDPEMYKEYRAEVDGLVGRTKVAVKTAGGAIAFGGLVTSFVHEVSSFGDVQQPGVLLGILPLGSQFVKAALPLAKKVMQISVTGIVLETESIFWGPKRFRVAVANGKEEDLRTASNVFEELEESPENDQLFKDALFSNGGRGLLMSVYRCDPDTAGRMLDASVPDNMRNEFGVKFMNAPEDKDYSFVNALTNADLQYRNRIVTDVLGCDQRLRARNQIVGETQKQVSENFTKWNSSQLTQLILANHHGSIDYALMQVGKMTIRLIPSMTAVYEYESYADSVREQARR